MVAKVFASHIGIQQHNRIRSQKRRGPGPAGLLDFLYRVAAWHQVREFIGTILPGRGAIDNAHLLGELDRPAFHSRLAVVGSVAVEIVILHAGNAVG